MHDFDDILTLNYNNDYQGVKINGGESEGIRCNGAVSIDGKMQAQEFQCADIIDTSRLVASNHLGVSDSVRFYVGGDASIENAPNVPDLMVGGLGKTVDLRPKPPGLPELGIGGVDFGSFKQTQPASLVSIINELREKIKELEARFETLES